MAQIKHKESAAEIQLKAIEFLHASINIPSASNLPVAEFNFNINLESKADDNKKLVFVVVKVEVKGKAQNIVIGSVAISCIYDIPNFEDIIKADPSGKINIPSSLVETLNSISISTIRGVMFSTFKGTFLHNAFLPVIDPKSMQGTKD